MTTQTITQTERIKLLEARIHNLEITLHGFWSILQDLQPPAYQESITRLFRDSFNASRELGAFSSTQMKDK